MYENLAKLPLTIETYSLEPLELTVIGGMKRLTTVIRLGGAGHDGVGEDVTYDDDSQLALQKHGNNLDLLGTFTLGDFCDKIRGLNLFTDQPKQEVYRNYRRWAFESAALDLALRQNNTSLAKICGRTPQPVHFIVSQRLGAPSSVDPLTKRLTQYPDLRFKIDAANDWTGQLLRDLAATEKIDTIDLKSFYKGTPVDIKTDPVLYQEIVDILPNALLEDADINEETKEILEPHKDRLTWDAPLHSVDDIKNLPYPPKYINSKPSRFGSIKELFSVYEYCEANDIQMYGGGQFELGPGRGQIQYLASLFHPDTPNDVAPIGYHHENLAEGLPTTHLESRLPSSGFRWE